MQTLTSTACISKHKQYSRKYDIVYKVGVVTPLNGKLFLLPNYIMYYINVNLKQVLEEE